MMPEQFVECKDDLVSQEDLRKKLFRRWDRYAIKVGRHIPRIVHLRKVTPEPEPDNQGEKDEVESSQDDVDMDEQSLEASGVEDVDMENGDRDAEEDKWDKAELEKFKSGHGGGGRPWGESVCSSKPKSANTCLPARIIHPAPKKKRVAAMSRKDGDLPTGNQNLTIH